MDTELLAETISIENNTKIIRIPKIFFIIIDSSTIKIHHKEDNRQSYFQKNNGLYIFYHNLCQ